MSEEKVLIKGTVVTRLAEQPNILEIQLPDGDIKCMKTGDLVFVGDITDVQIGQDIVTEQFNNFVGKKPRVFLGGTCNESTWRDELIEMLDPEKVEWFNPVVDDWTEECMEREIQERETCDFCLYVITPHMTGTYSIAEVVDDSNKRPEKTIFCVLRIGECYSDPNNKFNTISKKFDEGQMKSLNRVMNIVKENGGKIATDLQHVANWLNGCKND